MKRTLLFIFAIFFTSFIQAQETEDAVVAMSAEVDANTPSVTISWELSSVLMADSADILLIRREKDSADWLILLDTFGTKMTSYIDPNVDVGKTYEYGIYRIVTLSWISIEATGFLSVSIDAPAIDNRGKLLVFVEEAVETPLKMELDRLRRDLIGDGWQIIWHSVDEDATVSTIKNQIVSDYNNDPDNVKQVFLLGEIPVPYSGNSNWDGHGDHQGAWASDTYYGDVDGIWTDNVINNTTPSRAANDNVPGDGKFDQSYVPSTSELAVGRVDFSNLNEATFGTNTTELLRRYLDKNHNWRTKQYTVSNQALVDDNFGFFQGEAFAASAYRNYYPLVGKDNTMDGDFFTSTDDQSFLFGYGCGGGSYQSAAGVGNSTNFANDSVNIVFSMLFGSYHGDWDSDNNFMVSALASRGGILSCSWAGRPDWYYQYMGTGETLGYSSIETQNSCENIAYVNLNPALGECGTHVTLLGDPTLRAHIVAPISDLAISMSCSSTNLSWSPSAAPNNLGYHVYRSNEMTGSYTRLTTDPIMETNFTDNAPLMGNNSYQVKALVLEETPSGSYYNMSTGVISEMEFNGGNGNAPSISIMGENLTCDSPEAMVFANSDAVQPNFEWTGPNNFSMIGQTILVNQAGEYIVVVTDETTGCTATTSYTVLLNTDLPEATPEVSNDLNCITQTANISANPNGINYGFSWEGPDNFMSSLENISVDIPGLYTLTVFDNDNGCTNSFSVEVNEDISTPQANAGQDGALTCDIGSLILNGSATGGNSLSYSWTTPDGNIVSGPDTQNPMIDACGTYILIVVNNENGCTSTDEVIVECNFEFADITIMGTFEISCTSPAELIPVSSISDVTITWGGPGITDPNEVNPTVDLPGTYVVTIVNNSNGCVSTADINVSQNIDIPQTNPIAGGSITCIQSQVQLVANPSISNLDILWTAPDGTTFTEQNPIVSLPGVYTLVVTNPNTGCSSSNSVEVIEDIIEPTVDPGTQQQINCVISSVTLDGTNSSSGNEFFYQWATFDGNIVSGANTLTPEVDACGFYTLSIFNTENGCSSSADVIVTCDFVMPTVSIMGNDTIPCDVDAIPLEAIPSDPNFTLFWTGPGITDPSLPTQMVAESGTYTVVITNPSNGCTAEESIVIIKFPPFTVTSNTSTLDCDGMTTFFPFGTSGGVGPFIYTYEPSNPIPPNTPYTITITDVTGCEVIVTGTTPDFQPLEANLTYTDETVSGANDGTATVNPINGTPSFVFQWSNGQTTQTITDLEPNAYSVTITDSNGCQITETFEVLPGMVGIHNIEELESLSIYPNPTNGQFELNLILNDSEMVFVEIIDITGRILKRTIPEYSKNKNWKFDLSDYSSGLYLSKIWIGSEFTIRRIMKE